MRRITPRDLLSRCGVAMLGVSCITAQMTAAQLGASRERFFAPSSLGGRDLPADRIYPHGRQFPLSFFSVGGNRQGLTDWGPVSDEERRAVMRRVAGDGFTMFGPQYEINDRLLRDAAAHGVKAVYTVKGGWKKDDLKTVESEIIVQTIRERVEEALADEHSHTIAWWYVQPEELRYWRAYEIRYLELAADTIRKTDPLQRPVWMYDPGHRTATGLARTARFLDVVGKGMYTNYSGQVRDRVWCRWTIEQQKKAIEMVRSESGAFSPPRLPIAVPEMFQHPGKFVDEYATDEDAAVDAVKRWVRHDMYAALIQGAQGAIIFSLRLRGVGELPFIGRVHEAYYESYARVARDLTGNLGLGEVFLFGEWRDDIPVEVIEGPETITLEYRNNDPVDYPAIGLANIAVARDRYVILVNSAERSVSAMVSELPYGEDIMVRDLFADRAFPLGEGEFKVDFKPHEVRAFRIEAPDGM